MKLIPAPLKRFIRLSLIRRSRYFDEDWYRARNDVPAGTDAAAHYLDGGWKTSDPSSFFSNAVYLANHEDVARAGVCPLGHYVWRGRIEHRFITADGVPNEYRPRRLLRAVQRAAASCVYGVLRRKNRDARILVILHVYYEDSIAEIVEYLKNLNGYKWDLVVTISETRDVERIKHEFSAFRGDARFIVCPNNGYDIGPFSVAVSSVDADAYDIIVKLQSKRHFKKKGRLAIGQFMKGRDWFAYLYESTVGAWHVDRNIDTLLHDSGAGVLAAQNLIVTDPRHKVHLTRDILSRHGIKLPEDYTFIAGSCYMQRASLIRGLQELRLTAEDFESTERGYFSFAHALERWLTGSLDPRLLRGVNACPVRRFVRGVQGRKKVAEEGCRVEEMPGITLSDDFCLRFLENRRIVSYGIQKIALDDIYVLRKGRRTHLEDCGPYRYLLGDTEGYLDYCRIYRRLDHMTLSEEDFEKAVRDEAVRYQATIDDLEANGYDPSRPIIIDQNHCVHDGQHRACWLRHKYGPDYKAAVLVLDTTGKTRNIPIADPELARALIDPQNAEKDLKAIQRAQNAMI